MKQPDLTIQASPEQMQRVKQLFEAYKAIGKRIVRSQDLLRESRLTIDQMQKTLELMASGWGKFNRIEIHSDFTGKQSKYVFHIKELSGGRGVDLFRFIRTKG